MITGRSVHVSWMVFLIEAVTKRVRCLLDPVLMEQILDSTNPDFPLTTLRTYPPIHVLHAFVCSRGESGLTGIILSLSFPTKFRYLRDI